MRRLIQASFIAAALSLFSVAGAQGIPGISNPLIVTVVPDTPRANERVDISVQSFSFDLDRSLISWSVDGKQAASAVGKKNFSLVAGPLGTTKVVTVTATAPGTGTFTEAVVIRPADVALVWESDTYVPPFYRGKALHSYNGSFKVIALPDLYVSEGVKLSPKELIYTWKKNGEVQGSASGYGKSSFITSQTSYLREGETISVEVSAPRDNLVARSSITVIPTVPKIVFYEKSPLYGTIYEKSLSGRMDLVNEEITVAAEPYFFSAASRSSKQLSYVWTLDGNRLINFDNQPLVTLRRSGDSGGSSNISVTSQNSVKLLQGAQASLIIRYE